MPTANRTNQYLIGAAIIIVLIAAGLLWSRGDRAPKTPAAETKTATTTEEVMVKTTTTTADDRQSVTQAAGESVAADDQPAGMTVNASFTLSRDSWVGVRDASGILMGVGRFGPGATTGVIELLRATAPGETYTMVVFTDDGNRVYDLYADPIVEGVGDTFKAQ